MEAPPDVITAREVPRANEDCGSFLARSWRPSGLVAAGLEVVYTTTDPPLKAVRKVIPPLNLGSIRLDLGFMVLLIAVVLLRNITDSLAIRLC